MRRTAFAMLCWATVHRKREPDADLHRLSAADRSPLHRRPEFCQEGRELGAAHYRQTVGHHHGPTLTLAERLAASHDKAARWIGKDAVRELTNPKMLERIAKKAKVAMAAFRFAPVTKARWPD